MLKPKAALNKDRVNAVRGGSKPDMEHRHFAIVAGILRDIDASPDVVEAFADKLRETNPKFDRKRFLAAVREA